MSLTPKTGLILFLPTNMIIITSRQRKLRNQTKLNSSLNGEFHVENPHHLNDEPAKKSSQVTSTDGDLCLLAKYSKYQTTTTTTTTTTYSGPENQDGTENTLSR